MDQPQVDFKDRSADIKGRMRALLAFTAGAYTSDTRALAKDKTGTKVCVYGATESSPGCALGRHCAPKGVASRFKGAVHSLLEKHPRALPVWMRDFDTKFLSDIQRLHDNNSNWIPSGLSVHATFPIGTIERRIDTGFYGVQGPIK